MRVIRNIRVAFITNITKSKELRDNSFHFYYLCTQIIIVMNESLFKLNSRTKSGYIKRQIVSYCRHEGKNSIPEIAKKLEYSVPTITKYISELFDERFLLDYGKIETKTEGRHPNAYGVNPDSCYFMGVDIRW